MIKPRYSIKSARLNQLIAAKALLALACFKATLRLIDHVRAAFAANHTAIAVTAFQRLQAIANFHGSSHYKPA